VGSKWAGACTAAQFLKEFVDVARWMHIDMAGVAYASEEEAYTPVGMTGMPVRTLLHYLAAHQTNH